MSSPLTSAEARALLRALPPSQTAPARPLVVLSAPLVRVALLGVFNVLAGLLLIVGADAAADTDLYDPVRLVAPMPLWGLHFLGLGLLQLLTRPPTRVWALYLGVLGWTFWAACLTASIATDGGYPYVGPLLAGLVAVLHIAALIDHARGPG